jgi:hypothetical protein
MPHPIYYPQNDGSHPHLRASLGLLMDATLLGLLNHPLLVNPPIRDPRDPSKKLYITNARTYDGTNIENDGLSLLVYPYHREGSILTTNSLNAAMVMHDFNMGTGPGQFTKTTVTLNIVLTYRGYQKEFFSYYVPAPYTENPGLDCIVPENPIEFSDSGSPNNPNFREVTIVTYPGENVLYDYIELVRLALETDLRILYAQGQPLNADSYVEYITPLSQNWTEKDHVVLHKIGLLWKLTVNAPRWWNWRFTDVPYRGLSKIKAGNVVADPVMVFREIYVPK